MNDMNDLIPPIAGLVIAVSGYLFAQHLARQRKKELANQKVD